MERQDAGPGPGEAMSATDKPEEIEFLRLDEDAKHAHPVRIKVVSRPADEPRPPNPVRIRVRYASENEETTMTANEKPLPPRVFDVLGLIEEALEEISGDARIIAEINADDEDEALSILDRVRGAVEVLALFLIREADVAKEGSHDRERDAGPAGER
jgi:hypothetical protein